MRSRKTVAMVMECFACVAEGAEVSRSKYEHPPQPQGGPAAGREAAGARAGAARSIQEGAGAAAKQRPPPSLLKQAGLGSSAAKRKKKKITEKASLKPKQRLVQDQPCSPTMGTGSGGPWPTQGVSLQCDPPAASCQPPEPTAASATFWACGGVSGVRRVASSVEIAAAVTPPLRPGSFLPSQEGSFPLAGARGRVKEPQSCSPSPGAFAPSSGWAWEAREGGSGDSISGGGVCPRIGWVS